MFREHILTCFIDDPVGVKLRHEVGLDTILWECDYPHSDSTWPRAPERLMEYLEGVPDAEIAKITHVNAMREFRLDSFRQIPKEKCHRGGAAGPIARRGSGGPEHPRRALHPRATPAGR